MINSVGNNNNLNSPYSNNMNNQNFSSKNPYKDTQNWDKSKIETEGQKEELQKFKRFNDLKLINEQMINLSNNLQSEDSPLEILSQGVKGEIKNTLAKRIGLISFLPALSLVLLAVVIIFFENVVATFSIFLFVMFVFGRTLFYPAKLYYENFKYKTNKHAEEYFEEVDYWFKMGVVNTLVSIIFTSILFFIVGILENTVIEYLYANYGASDNLIAEHISSMSFAIPLIVLSVFQLLLIVGYFVFINKEKQLNTEVMSKSKKKIRNETMSRVSQIQADKNEI